MKNGDLEVRNSQTERMKYLKGQKKSVQGKIFKNYEETKKYYEHKRRILQFKTEWSREKLQTKPVEV